MSDNEAVCISFLQALVDRGLSWEQGLLCIIDGAKELRAANRRIFGTAARVQRCQWDKRENVLRYLSKSQQASWRRKLRAAYEQASYTQARATLAALQRELSRINLSAAQSLAEALEKTLTLHRLGLFPQMGRRCLNHILDIEIQFY